MLAVSHMVGDFIFQTDWQARTKKGGLGGNRESRRALASHMATYMLAFIPALIWLTEDVGPLVVVVAAGILIPHGIQDDSRLLARYAQSVKGLEIDAAPTVAVWIDQSFHSVALFVLALAIAA